MIITVYGVIVFYLVGRIALIQKVPKWAFRYGEDMFGFAYPALRTRHEIPR